VNYCCTCNEDFGCVSAIDAHRVGKILQAGPAEYSDRVEKRLVPHPKDADWKPAYGRRCLDTEEMLASGKFEQNAFGAWSLSRDLARGREILSAAS